MTAFIQKGSSLIELEDIRIDPVRNHEFPGACSPKAVCLTFTVDS